MFELIERTGGARAIPARYDTYAEATAALTRRAGEQGITVACLRPCA
jgi:hypothetical protein